MVIFPGQPQESPRFETLSANDVEWTEE